VAEIVRQNLRAIGIELELRRFPFTAMLDRAGRRGEPFDLVHTGWGADYPDPYVFLNKLLSGSGIQARNNVNYSYFDDPRFDRELDAAARLTGDERFERYGELDVELARDGAPLAVFGNQNSRDFFSARMGCQVYNPVYGMSFAALCLRD